LPSTGGDLTIAAHAVLVGAPGGSAAGGSETGWADGFDFPGANWATYLVFRPLLCLPHE
jgi:hypothetical protein